MITGITIENFKGIREKVEIDLRPLTLLFGANSAGKSSILHAIQYAAEVYERRNLNAGSIGTGSAGIDLGGFGNFVHGHDKTREVTIGFRLNCPADRSFATFDKRTPRDVDDPSTLYEMPESATVSISIGWSEFQSAPFVSKYAVAFDGQELAKIESEPGNPDVVLHLNEVHPAFVRNPEHSALTLWDTLGGYGIDSGEGDGIGDGALVLARLMAYATEVHAVTRMGNSDGPYTAKFGLSVKGDALPDLERSLAFDADKDWSFREPENIIQLANDLDPFEPEIEIGGMLRLLRNEIGKDWDKVRYNPRSYHAEIERLIENEKYRNRKQDLNRIQKAILAGSRLSDLADYLAEAISQMVIGPGRMLRDLLIDSRYLGPIREVPQRNHTPSRQNERARWSSGLGAWDRLETADEKFIEKVSGWLGDESRLNSGYRLRLKSFKELDLSDPMVVDLLTGRAFDDLDSGTRLSLDKLPTRTRLLIVPTDESIELRPNDVGVGISQVVPVIVTALDGEGRFIAIEQPELHIHPRLQAEIGDLLIEGTSLANQGHRFLIETHSEHLILRIQRRIRETTNGENRDGQTLLSDDVAVYHVSSENQETRVRLIDVDRNGEFVQPWPDDFFEIDFYERFGRC